MISLKCNDDNHCSENIINDVQLWGDEKFEDEFNVYFKNIEDTNNTFFEEIPKFFDCNSIPISLFILYPLNVYSNSTKTQNFFKKKLFDDIDNNQKIGIVFRNKKLEFESNLENESNLFHLIFFFDISSSTIKVLLFNFFNYKKLKTIIELNKLKNKSFHNNIIIIENHNQYKHLNKLDHKNFYVLKKSEQNIKSKSLNSKLVQLYKEKSKKKEFKSFNEIYQEIKKIILNEFKARNIPLNLKENYDNGLKVNDLYEKIFESTVFALKKFNFKNIDDEKNVISSKSTNALICKKNSINHFELQKIIRNLIKIFIDIDK